MLSYSLALSYALLFLLLVFSDPVPIYSRPAQCKFLQFQLPKTHVRDEILLLLGGEGCLRHCLEY